MLAKSVHSFRDSAQDHPPEEGRPATFLHWSVSIQSWCGRLEARLPDRPSQKFIWDDTRACRLRTETLDREAALKNAKAAARAASLGTGGH